MKVIRMLLILLPLLGALAVPVLAATDSSTGEPPEGSARARVEESARTFDPEATGKQLEEKGMELLGMAKGGSVLYIAVAAILFLLLLFGGLMYRPLIKAAFFVLLIAVLGFVGINYWPELLEAGRAVMRWLTTKGGTGNEASPGA